MPEAWTQHSWQDLTYRINIVTNVRDGRAGLSFLATQTDPLKAWLKCVSSTDLYWKSFSCCFLHVSAHQRQKPCRVLPWL